MLLAFSIWLAMGVLLIGLGIYDYKAKSARPFGFWANVEAKFSVKNVQAYNKALGKLFVVFGILFILLGLPLLFMEQNSALFMIPVVGTMLLSIGAMVVYTVVIEPKYRK